jgi:hypothetical protein
MNERYEATTLQGFVQYLAANILPHGYWFYVTGHVPEGKDPEAIDEKLIQKYDCLLSRTERARRKKAGWANVRYLRLGRFWVLLATEGKHPFFEEETRVRDVRRVPLQLGGYSIWVKRGQFLKRAESNSEARRDGKYRTRVLISRDEHRKLVAYFERIACHRSEDKLRQELLRIPFEPYAPVRRQLLRILYRVNELRKAAGYSKLDYSSIRYHRQPIKPFGDFCGQDVT